LAAALFVVHGSALICPPLAATVGGVWGRQLREHQPHRFDRHVSIGSAGAAGIQSGVMPGVGPADIGIVDDRDPIGEARAGLTGAVDVLRRVADTTALHVYEMEFLEDGGYRCTTFLGEGVARLLGRLPEGMGDEDAWEQAVHPDDRAVYDRVVSALQRGQGTELEYRLVGYDGITRWVWERCVPQTAVDGRIVVHGVAADVTERHRMAEQLAETQARLAHLAYHDPLTGLANRLHYQEQLDQAVTRARAAGGGVAVLFIDLDGFKRVNDELGHATGDELLCEVARRLSQATRSEDLIARLGGDEFLALVDGSSPSGQPGVGQLANEVAARVTAALADAIVLPSATLRISASIGVATYPTDATTGRDLIQHADLAMYCAKHANRDTPPLAA
jgi:diguanylate cyclase (GGDEF)-like protein/PAS domain S-box-containing protein